MNEQERWTQVCEPKLNGIERDLKKLLKVVVEGNGEPGLVTRMALTEKAIDGLVRSQQIPQQKTVSSKGKTFTKIKTPFGEMQTNDPRVMNGIKIAIMLLGLGIAIGATLFIMDHLQDTRKMMIEEIRKDNNE